MMKSIVIAKQLVSLAKELINASPAATDVFLSVENDSILAFRQGLVGRLDLVKSEDMTSSTVKDILNTGGDALKDFLSSVGAKTIWLAYTVKVLNIHRNTGVGLALYEKALSLAAKEGACLASARSTGWVETSPDAERLWVSLTRRFPHCGEVVWGGKIP